MNKITFPLAHSQRGREVSELQTALRHCLDRDALLSADPGR